MEKNNIKLYRYPQKTNVKTSYDIIEHTPIYWNKLYPGERIEKLTYETLTRMITPLHPTLDVAKIKLYAFAVPVRLISPNTYNPSYDAYKYIFDISCLNGINEGFLYNSDIFVDGTVSPESNVFKKFGLPTDAEVLNYISTRTTRQLNFDYVLAYHKIYFDFFKNKKIESADFSQVIKYLNDNIDRNKDGKVHFDVNNSEDKMFWGGFSKLRINNVDNDVIENLTITNVQNKVDVSWSGTLKRMFENYVYNVKNLEHINYGTQKDLLLKIWNKTNGSKTNVELIGFSEWYQQIEQITNTAKNFGQSLGEVGGMSVVYNKDVLINNFVADEETIILVVASPEYNTEFIDFVDMYQWMQPEKYAAIFADGDFNPNMLNVVDEFNYINFWGYNNTYDGILAYAKPFNYLTKQYNVVAGDIRDKWASWTYNRVLSGSNASNPFDGLNIKSFKNIKAPFKNTLVSPTQDAFISEFNFSGDFYRYILPDYILKDKALKGE